MRTIERRIGLLFAGFLLCFLVIACRAFWLQGVQGAKLASEAAYQQTDIVTVPGLRGSVLDRFGNPLAVSEDAKTIYATPYQVKQPRQVAAKLASILDLEEGEVLESLTEDSGFAYVARKVDLPSAARVARLELAGIGELPDSRRTYPQGGLAAQTIGAVGDEGQGLTGLEKGKDPVLRGSDGERRIVNDALGEPIRLETVSEASDGEDLRLTLDPAIQKRAEEVLGDVGETYAPNGATAIVMDPRDSELLAIANWPPVDPTDLESADPDDLINRATGFTYEPGSTFKAFTVAAALEEGQVTPESYFTLPPTIQVADRVIEESHARGTATMSVAEILAHSSNVGAVTIGLGLGSEKFSRWITRFGFGHPTGVRFPAEEQGIVPALEEYSGSTMGNLPLGQGLAVTPMQMMAAYAAIANDGFLRPPRLIESIGDEALPAPRGSRVIDADVAAQVRSMLEGVLAPGGTASEVSVPGYTLAGKTGTSQVAENGTYSETKYVASFIGFAPAQDPRLLVAVIVDQPQGSDYYGGSVAAPAFGEIAEFALPYLGVPQE
jgi:cell division protein FtsI (penicillin-binding protein 3)